MKLPDITPVNTIRTFALVIVAITSAFVMGMVIWLTRLLSDPSWCDRAIGAAKGADRPETAFGGCFQLLTQQMSALAINSYIFGGVIALCLAALMIIVVAGGKISFTGNKDGVSANLSGNGETPPPAPPALPKTEVKPTTDTTLEDTP